MGLILDSPTFGTLWTSRRGKRIGFVMTCQPIGSKNSPFRHIQFVPEGKISNLGEGVTRRIAATSEGSADQAAIRTPRRYVTNGSCWAWRCDSTMDSRDLWLGTGRAANDLGLDRCRTHGRRSRDADRGRWRTRPVDGSGHGRHRIGRHRPKSTLSQTATARGLTYAHLLARLATRRRHREREDA
jgi:hypothetical protein